jgi:hypothetical protein
MTLRFLMVQPTRRRLRFVILAARTALNQRNT